MTESHVSLHKRGNQTRTRIEAQSVETSATTLRYGMARQDDHGMTSRCASATLGHSRTIEASRSPTTGTGQRSDEGGVTGPALREARRDASRIAIHTVICLSVET